LGGYVTARTLLTRPPGDKAGLPVETVQGVSDMRVDIVDLLRDRCPGRGVVIVDDLLEQSGNPCIGPRGVHPGAADGRSLRVGGSPPDIRLYIGPFYILFSCSHGIANSGKGTQIIPNIARILALLGFYPACGALSLL
jgi:hypothetical protein